ncbi:MAG: heme exporter protein CcmD [Gammaproteobacteria bacterium]
MSMMEFFAMGGHGPYIWGSYGVMAALMIWEARQVIARKRRALRSGARTHGGRS